MGRTSRIKREKQIVGQMIGLYCRGHHLKRAQKEEKAEPSSLCLECEELLAYAHLRLDRCKFGEEKTFCERCSVHCYKKDMRERIKQVMRYSGPRMLLYHPVMTLRHYLRL
ncbi:nitrous oxide-stimulated promoter family protein [Gorillibacterium sp. CAU 1737]|uniref:nitrous oxide-stimulated promoter family protein n=1 Tax=Gorillibacterium sp. CAU 1737 TaxID=3140362 RepID=UPI003260C2D2